jgi:hypothetical protein
LTGESSREPLDRIRYLRHELNAFSQLQQEQIDVLGQVTRALLQLDGPQDHEPNDPHPRHAVFAALPKGVEIQNDVVQMLSGMLDGLQSEVRATCPVIPTGHPRSTPDKDVGSCADPRRAGLA